MPRYQITIEKRIARRAIVEVTAEDQPSAEQMLREIEKGGGSLLSPRKNLRPLQQDTLDLDNWIIIDVEEVSE